jgi:peptide/nickel transport system substrate-binding protein
MDREKVVKAVLKGYGRIGNDQLIPASDPFFAADIPQPVATAAAQQSG